jgi:CheY-like chemotaxis protein
VPAHIAVVHDDPEFLDRIAAALSGAGDDIRTYSTALAALIALDQPRPIDVLITRMRFPPGESNGLSLALIARRQNPNIKILFIAAPEFEEDAADLGTFLPTPVAIPDIINAVDGLLGS